MAHTYALGIARTSSAANPVTVLYTVGNGDTVVALLLKGVGNTDRAGGAPSLGGIAMTQASTTQKAASSPEASAELWYMLNPPIGTFNLIIPNTGPITLFYTVAIGRSATGVSALDGASGSNNTSTNPTPGAVTVTVAGDIAFAITAGGWTTWAPSAQVGTVIANTDDGTHGGGEQYILNPAVGSHTLSWTQTSDDWGAVSAYFKEAAAAAIPIAFNNYLAVKVGDGVSVTERIR